MKPTNILFALLAGAIVAFPFALRAQDASSSDRQFESIGRLIEKADQALQDKKRDEAIQLYGATIAAYRDYAERFPDFYGELIQFRSAYCQQQLKKLLVQKAAPAVLPVITNDAVTAQEPVLDEQALLDVSKGYTLCEIGQFDEADRLVMPILKKTPDATPALLVLATVRLGQGNTDVSKRLLERILALNPGHASAHYNLCQLILRDESPDYEKAQAHYLQAKRFGAPEDPDLESVLDIK
ncbi:MAG TPA: hypothetical protein DCS43_01035 [Verrucomicrobia bacterium]|nr:hypothetical protein [Verrucomicrobiota bacterium]